MVTWYNKYRHKWHLYQTYYKLLTKIEVFELNIDLIYDIIIGVIIWFMKYRKGESLWIQ